MSEKFDHEDSPNSGIETREGKPSAAFIEKHYEHDDQSDVDSGYNKLVGYTWFALGGKFDNVTGSDFETFEEAVADCVKTTGAGPFPPAVDGLRHVREGVDQGSRPCDIYNGVSEWVNPEVKK